MSDPLLPALNPPVFSDPRRLTLELHTHLRRLIMDAVLAPGTTVKQAELARAFRVSRTPMREAFRMLQEEGLLEVSLNQVARVRALDPTEIDQLYAVRITLEALAVRVTAGRISPAEVAHARDLLKRLDEHRAAADVDAWMTTHREFHGSCMVRADEPLIRVISSYAERCERYLRMHQLGNPHSYDVAGDQHHRILNAVEAGDSALAGALMAEHLSTTSRAVLADVAPEVRAAAIEEAVSMVCGTEAKTL